MAPVLTLPSNLTLAATNADGAIATFGASALDAIDGAVAVACTPPSGSVFPITTTPVTCAALDSAGQVATGGFTVTVRDITAPVLTLPANQTLAATDAAGAIVNFTATAVDAVTGPVPVDCTPLSGSMFPIGVTLVTCTATDGAGNTTSGSFTVTVTSSLVAPRITSPRPAEEIGVGQLYTYRFVASGSEPLIWSLDRAPAGMTIDAATGVMSWQPTAAQRGERTLVVRVRNAAGTTTRRYVIKVV